MKKIVLSLVLVLTVVFAARAVEPRVIEFVKGSTEYTKNSQYYDTWESTDGFWQFSAFNNNMNGWDFIAAGWKTSDTTPYFATLKPVDAPIENIVITISDRYTKSAIEAATLYVADNADFINAAEIDVLSALPEARNSDMTFNVPNSVAGSYIKVQFTIPKQTSNGQVISISRIAINYDGANTSVPVEVESAEYKGTIAIYLTEEPAEIEDQKVSINATGVGTCDFDLDHFSLDGQTDMGNIHVSAVKTTKEEGSGLINYAGSATNIVLNLTEDEYIYADVDIEGTEDIEHNLQMNIHVKWLMNGADDHENTIPIEVTFNGSRYDGGAPIVEPDGSDANPYIIATAEDLCNAYQKVVPDKVIYFKQTADIDMAGVKDWHAINGTWGDFTSGIVYDGGNHVIKNFSPDYVTDGGTQGYYNGSIFGVLSGIVMNLGVVDAKVDMKGENRPAGILGAYFGHSSSAIDLEASVIRNVFVTGEIDCGSYYSGGLFGTTGSDVEIVDCYANVKYSGTGGNMGGIIGRINHYAVMGCCYVAGTVNPEAGLVAGGGVGTLDVNGLVVLFNTGSDKVCTVNLEGEVLMANTPSTRSAGILDVQDWSAFSSQKTVLGYPGLASFDYTADAPIIPGTHNLTITEVWCNGVKNGVANPIPDADGSWGKPTALNSGDKTVCRFAVGKDGKLLMNNHRENAIMAWDGKAMTTFAKLPAVTVTDWNGNEKDPNSKWNGTAITTDDAGNVIYNYCFIDVDKSLKYWGVVAADGTITDVYLSTPLADLGTHGRLDILGHIVGDVNSEKGGIGYATTLNSNNVIMFHFKGDGKKVTSLTAKSFEVAGLSSNGLYVPSPKYLTVDELMANGTPEKEFYVPYGGLNSEAVLNGYLASGDATLTGFGNRQYNSSAVFALGEKKYIVRSYVSPENPKADALTGWRGVMTVGIYDLENGNLVTSWQGSEFSNSYGMGNISTEIVNNRTVNIYIYVATATADATTGTQPGAYAAMLRLTDEDIPLLITNYTFVSATPRSGTSFSQSEGLPKTIETHWSDVGGVVVIHKNAELKNQYGETVAYLTLASEPSTITLTLDAVHQAVGEYTIVIPAGAFTDASGNASNEEASIRYNVKADGGDVDYAEVEGKYWMNINEVYTNNFGIDIPDKVVVDREDNILSIVFENFGGFESLSVPAATYNAATRDITFMTADYGKIPISTGLSMYVRFEPVVYNQSTGAYDKTSYTVKYNQTTGTIAFPAGHGFLWTVYRDSNYSQFYGNLVGLTVNSLVKYENAPVVVPQQLAAPTISYNGRYATITAEEGAEIMMSLNWSNYFPYNGTFDVYTCTAIETYAVKDGYLDSEHTFYQVTSYGSDLYGNIYNEGTLDEAFRWTDEATRDKILSNPNFLLYVDGTADASRFSGITNLVVNGVAERISLSDRGEWFCIQDFYARHVSYTRSFSKQTAINGGCAGWETIALPFDVQTIESEEAGLLYPFAANSDSDAHRFWLYEPTGADWAAASKIEAHKPYLIAMPNNPIYSENYNISGDVIFSAENVDIVYTYNEPYDYRDGYKITPYFNNVYNVKDDGTRLVVNDAYTVEDDLPGSCFVADEHAVRPFEAYLTAPGQQRVSIFHPTSLPAELMDEMSLRVWSDTPQTVSIFAPVDVSVGVYDISGRAVRTVKVAAGYTARLTDLPAGIYIIEKTKIAIRK